MQTLYAVACLALLGLYFVQAQLPQYPIYPDLGGLLDLGAVLPATPATFSGTPDGAECDLSQCQGSMDTSTASFDDSGQTILICNCDGAQLDPNALVYGLGQVPLFLRQNVKGVTAIPSDTAHAYTAAGRITIFGFVEPDVFIHEATHAQDNGFSSSSAFKEALADDPCVPDAYAQTNEVECYAQDMVVFLYKLWKGTTPDPGTDCMSNQLQAIHKSNAWGLQDYIKSVPSS